MVVARSVSFVGWTVNGLVELVAAKQQEEEITKIRVMLLIVFAFNENCNFLSRILACSANKIRMISNAQTLNLPSLPTSDGRKWQLYDLF